jgi:hypothetical protein
MKKTSFNYLAIASLSVLFSFIACACLKQTAYTKPLNNNFSDSLITIKTLRKLHTMGMAESILNAIYVKGVVVANDEHDNIYKALYIQDNTGAIVVQMDGLSVYQNYPIGTEVKLHLQNLILTDYRRMVQLAATVDSSTGTLSTAGIPSPLYAKFIEVERENVPVLPLQVSAKILNDSLQGRLIQLMDVEFSASDTSQTYADKKNKVGASRALKFCAGGTIYLRTSGYADFAGVKIPSGNGILIGIYSVFNTEKQILLRDTNDILLNGKRCTGAAWLQNLPLKGGKALN